MKKNVLILILILFGSRLFAQTFTVQGTVTDAKTNEALVGVSVVEKGTTNGVVTDIDGHFDFFVYWLYFARYSSQK